MVCMGRGCLVRDEASPITCSHQGKNVLTQSCPGAGTKLKKFPTLSLSLPIHAKAVHREDVGQVESVENKEEKCRAGQNA